MNTLRAIAVTSSAGFLAAILTACSPPSPREMTDATKLPTTPAEKTAVKKRLHAAKNVSSWTINGAIAASNQRKNWTASINWKQQGMNQYQIHLFGPLGGGSVIVEKKGPIVTYQDGPKRVKTTNIDELFYKETGVRVPLHNLYYWVRAIPAPGGIQSSTKDPVGHYTSLKQGGYTVTYSGYQTVNGVDLPTKIRVTGPGGRLKLVIKQWKIA